jgi:hypothetical protein
MIVAIHASLPGDQSDSLLLVSLSYITAPGIGIFYGLWSIAIASKTKDLYVPEKAIYEDCHTNPYLDIILPVL